jgi:hypothetical protein
MEGHSCTPIIVVKLNPDASTSIVVTVLSLSVPTATIVAVLDSYITSPLIPHAETPGDDIRVA